MEIAQRNIQKNSQSELENKNNIGMSYHQSFIIQDSNNNNSSINSNHIVGHQSDYQRFLPINNMLGLPTKTELAMKLNRASLQSQNDLISRQHLHPNHHHHHHHIQHQTHYHPQYYTNDVLHSNKSSGFIQAQSYNQQQPIYNPIYQSVRGMCQAATNSYQVQVQPNQASVMSSPNSVCDNLVKRILPGQGMNDLRNQVSSQPSHAFRHSINLSYNLPQYQSQFNNDGSKLFLPTLTGPLYHQAIESTIPTERLNHENQSPSNSTAVTNSCLSTRNDDRWQQTEDDCSTNVTKISSNQKSKLVASSRSNSDSSNQKASRSPLPLDDRKFKSYLAHLVLSSNIPFAYAIILVAFLITVITATSIITILTVVLTLTGYTAYPLTENSFNISLAIGVVCASFALALVTASLIVWRRHCQAAYYYLDDPQTGSRGTNSPQLSETYDDSEYGSLPVNEWGKHVQKLHADGDIGFSREFEQIQQAKNSNLTCEHSQMAENKHKNRYINIVAYDHTRVTLRILPGQKKPGADYINANYIDVSSKHDNLNII